MWTPWWARHRGRLRAPRWLCPPYRPSPPLAQFAAQNLADVRLRQRVEEFDDLRRLVGGHFLAAVRDQVFGGQRGVRRLDDEQFYRLAGLVVGDPDTGAFDDPRTAGRHGFHLV